MKNIFNYEETALIVLKLFMVILVIISIAILVKLGIEINNAVQTNKEVNELKQKYITITMQYNELHKEVEKELAYEY